VGRQMRMFILGSNHFSQVNFGLRVLGGKRATLLLGYWLYSKL
jgi:hypothetical protein